jgi:hypothetical protein
MEKLGRGTQLDAQSIAVLPGSLSGLTVDSASSRERNRKEFARAVTRFRAELHRTQTEEVNCAR